MRDRTPEHRDNDSSPSMLNSVLISAAKFLVVVLSVLTLLPHIRTGYWVVRLCDFPRVQLLLLLLVPVLLTVGHAILIRRIQRQHLWLFGAIAVIGIWQGTHVIPFTPLWRKELADLSGGEEIRLMVANVKMDNDRSDEISEAIRSEDPDLLLLIEIDNRWKTNLSSLSEEYPYRVEEIRHQGLGLALWSKIPIKRSDVEYLVTDRRPAIFADLTLPDGNMVRFVGVHPTPPGLDDETKGGRRDSRVRDAELVLVAKEVKKAPDSGWIVAGDFNDVAWSHTTRLFKRLSGLKDPRVGRTLLNTYHSEYPLLRYPIDQVFLSEGSEVESIHRVRLPGSDHFAVVLDIQPASHTPAPPAPEEDETEAREIVDEGEEDAAKRNISD